MGVGEVRSIRQSNGSIAGAASRRGSKKRRAPPPPAPSTPTPNNATVRRSPNNEAGVGRSTSNVPNTLERFVMSILPKD